MIRNRSTTELLDLADQYDARSPDAEPRLQGFAQILAERQRFTREELYGIAKWKSVRKAAAVLQNSDEYVREVTSLALQPNSSERLRIEVLITLYGVKWPTASVVLHAFAPDKYPILDKRALHALGVEKPNSYKFEFWQSYCDECRGLAAEKRLTLRQLDKAMWMASWLADGRPASG